MLDVKPSAHLKVTAGQYQSGPGFSYTTWARALIGLPGETRPIRGFTMSLGFSDLAWTTGEMGREHTARTANAARMLKGR